MQKPEELVEEITKEEQELDIKLTDLECFMMSADFIKVSPEQKTLLEQQHKAMTEYKLILIKRAHRINWEAGRDKAAAEIKKATESKDPNEREHGCAGCQHAEYVPGGNGRTICGNPRADGKTCWEEQDGTSLDK